MTINSITHQWLEEGVDIRLYKEDYDLQEIQNSKPNNSDEISFLVGRRGIRQIQRCEE